MLLSAQNIGKSYQDGHETLEILKNINLAVQNNEKIAIVGASGSGKSTLLHILGLLDTPSKGQLILDGNDVAHLSEKDRAKLRSLFLGFIYQFHHLLTDFSALENVMMPLQIQGVNYAKSLTAAKEILDKIGLSHRLNTSPSLLSGGERQRVAIARAMVHSPKLLIADEPTGNLDKKNADNFYTQLLNLTHNTACIVVTHDLELAKKMDTIYHLEEGCLVRYE